MRVKFKKIFSIYPKFINNFLSITTFITVVFITNGFFIFNFKIVNALSDNITQMNIITNQQTLDVDVQSSLITVQTQNIDGAIEKVSEATHLVLTSTSPTGKFFDANASSNTCTDILQEPFTLTLRSGSANKSFCYQDSTPGSHTINVSADGKSWTNASQIILINGVDTGDDGSGDTGDTGDDGSGDTGQSNFYTEITSDISSDTVWTKENSPYVINDLISVLPGATLTVNEGVVVKFGNDGGLIVNGKLDVLGTPSSKVYFTSINDDSLLGDTNNDGESYPSVGDWHYLFFDSDLESNLNNLEINYSDDGVVAYYDTSVLIDNLFSDNKITMIGASGTFNNLHITGLEVLDHSNIDLNNSDIHGDSSNVISVYNTSFLNIQNSNIGGRYDSITVFNNSSVSIYSSDIYSNSSFSGSAISAFSNSKLDIDNSKLECAHDCIWVYSNSSLNLSNSDIFGLHDGLDIYNNENQNINVENAKISDSLNAGLMIFSNTNSSINISASEIYDNDYGFIVFDSPISVKNSSIHDNFSAGATTYTENDLDFVSNYWGDKTGPTHSSNASGLGDTISDHILYMPFLPYDPLSGNTRNPVILIPGITGTYLYENYGDKKEIWPNVLKMFTSIPDDYLDVLSLNKNGTENINYPIIPGDIIRGISSVHVFDLLIDDLKENGYIEGEDLFVFPYDWRFSTSDVSIKLKEKIDNILVNTEYQKVDIIAHSMGGLIAKDYIANNGSDKIDQLIFLGTPQLGSPKAFKTLMFGDDMSYKFLILRMNPQKAKYISQNMPSVYELLPSKKYVLLNNEYISIKDKDVNIPLDYEQTKNLMIKDGRNSLMFPFAENLHDKVDYLNLSNVQTYNFIGCGSQTIGKINIGEKKSWLQNIFNKNSVDYKPYYTDGDGTVPLVSASQAIGSETYYVNGVSHGSLPASSNVINWVISILGGPQTQFDDTVQDSDRYCGIEGDILSVHSPVELHVYDEDGNHVGPDENGDIEYGIPGVSYDVFDDVKYVFVPKGKNFKVAIKALDTGGFNLSIDEQSGEDITDTHNWTLIPLKSDNSYGEIFIGPDYSSDEYMVKMDENGNGDFDKNYPEGFDGTSEAEKTTSKNIITSGSVPLIKDLVLPIPTISKTFEDNINTNQITSKIVDYNNIITKNTEKISSLENSSKDNNKYTAEAASTSLKVKFILPIIILSIILIILLAKMFIKL